MIERNRTTPVTEISVAAYIPFDRLRDYFKTVEKEMLFREDRSIMHKMAQNA